jgi:superfamily II DNA or RNA helicase
MDGYRLSSPIASALGIREQYHRSVETELKTCGIDDITSKTIITDIFAKDDIYFSLNRAYECIQEDFTTFCKNNELHSSLRDMLPNISTSGRHLYTHQAQAIESIQQGKTTIISTGTGSGKTESFLIPILDYCLKQKSRQSDGIKALILYPLNALANDQIRRILNAVRGTGIRVGCYIGSTPQEKQRTSNDQPELCISRREMTEKPPDILITNFIMLDRLITKPASRSMFKHSATTLKYIVVDEIHYFRGTKGANLSLLLRRLRTLCQTSVIQIGASGTLRRGGGYYPNQAEDQIEKFARLIFGHEAIDKGGLQLIKPVFQKEEPDEPLDSLPKTDRIDGETFLEILDKEKAIVLCEQLFGIAALATYRLKYQQEEGLRKFPGYYLISKSPFVHKIRQKLAESACIFSDFIQLFRQMYKEIYGREPDDAKSVVEAYWSLIDYLNERCQEAKLPPVLDYRIHLILNDVGEALKRCLQCGRYHDGRCLRCRYCNNGLLFKVSERYPDQCIAYLVRNELFAERIAGKQVFPVLVKFETAADHTEEKPVFTLEALPTDLDEAGYHLQPVVVKGQLGITIELAQDRQNLEPLLISDAHIYWHNVLKIIDALVIQEETRTSDKLLGFIDNRERASGLKLRLNDDFAERMLIRWAASQWQDYGKLSLIEAYEVLQQAIPYQASEKDDESEQDHIRTELFQEAPFWFNRMLTYLQDSKQYEGWKMTVDENLSLSDDERELLERVVLPANAVDRTDFGPVDTSNLRHFHLDKYRVETQFGVGIHSSTEKDFHIISLGERGVLYQEFIERVGNNHIEAMLHDLADRKILAQKKTPRGLDYYQICPQQVYLEVEASSQVGERKLWRDSFALVECHTADHSNEERARIEERFSRTLIQALICTPTLEMGVDIGSLSCVMMIGFPPSPANYAQRAGRAGRSEKTRRATITVLSSSHDAHDEYYYALPTQMIDGAITPPQFTLKNFALLAAHSYAHILAGTPDQFLHIKLKNIERDIQQFLWDDELQLTNVLEEGLYQQFVQYLLDNSITLTTRIVGSKVISPTLEDYYKSGIFPDYGFRNDGLPLFEKSLFETGGWRRREDQDHALTVREPEEAPRKLVPGRVVFCGGRAVKVDEEQPAESFRSMTTPDGKDFRLPRYVVADLDKPLQVERWRDPTKLYRMTRLLDIKRPLEELEIKGPRYCEVYFVPASTLYFINEGEVQPDNQYPVLLRDRRGSYRFGATIEREGLLVRCSNQILSPHMKASFLAVLLRSIPDCFNLDDTELRVVQNIRVHPQGTLGEERADFFIYGHDKSGLVPFKDIFEQLEDILSKALSKLKTCTCNGSGCYLCLFSMNSHTLVGRISHQEAVAFISAYLKEERLRPHIVLKPKTIVQADSLFLIKVKGDQWMITMKDIRTGKSIDHVIPKANDQSSALYHGLHHLLKQAWNAGSRSVEIYTNVDYVRKQLNGENDIKQGRAAFFPLWLERVQWKSWQIMREEQYHG